MNTFFLTLAMIIPCLSFSTPAQVIVFRHAEKPPTGHELTLEGFERAGALSFYFQLDPFVLDFGLPIAIFAAKPRHGMDPLREVETVTPLANALHMPVHFPFLSENVNGIADFILNHPGYDGKMVLICWEHGVMDALAQAFGVTAFIPPYPINRYDLVYKITFPPSDPSNPTFCIGLENLMQNDSPIPPPGFPLCS